MFAAILWSILLRCTETCLAAAPFVLCGVFVAAIFRRFLGSANTRRLFGGGGFRGLLVGWLMGMLLPVCSLGAIPVVRELRRAGVPGGTLLAFALAAPLFNPLSLLYGLTLSEPTTILGFAFCSLIVVTLVGAIWDRMFPGSGRAEPELPPVAYGPRRLLSLLSSMGREMTGASLGYMAIGLAGVALLAAVLPAGSLQRTMNRDQPLAPLLMTAVAVPAYATPMQAMSQLGMMFQHGNSVGAAFVLLALGAGMNLGTVAWTMRSFGWRSSLGWFLLLLVVVLGLSYGVDRPLAPAEGELADHTHAFDGYCRAFTPDTVNPGQIVGNRLRENVPFFEVQSLKLLGILVATGMVQRLSRRWFDLEAWLERKVASGPARFDVIVSPAVVGGVILLGIVAFSVVGCFAYYPPPEEIFEEMFVAQGEALGTALSGDVEHAVRWIEVLDDWSRKLEVGVYLRRGDLSEYHRMKARLFREKLELLEHEVKDREMDEVRVLVPEVSRCYLRLKSAYLQDL